MSSMDIEVKRMLREMNATKLPQAIVAREETVSMPLGFDERVRRIVGEAHWAFITSVAGGANHNTFAARGSCALAKQACRNSILSRYVRVPDLEEEWLQVHDQLLGSVFTSARPWTGLSTTLFGSTRKLRPA